MSLKPTARLMAAGAAVLAISGCDRPPKLIRRCEGSGDYWLVRMSDGTYGLRAEGAWGRGMDTPVAADARVEEVCPRVAPHAATP